MGYDVKWGVIGARDCGAPHQRDRMWIVARRRFAAYTDEVGPEKHGHFSTSPAFISSEIITDGDRERLEELRRSSTEEEKLRILGRCGWWRTEPRVDRVVNGLAHRVDRVAATGDGQVPEVARTAWEILSKPELIER
jgi:DNA (cytosine-5)-methyltransferase 1